jgi:hypothetical protein
MMTPRQPTAGQAEWTILKEFSGEIGLTRTEPFTTTTPTFRISWKATEVDRGGVLDIYVWTDAGRLVTVAAGLQDHVKRSSVGQFIVNSDPGAHYLEVRGTGVRWHVTIERPKA